MRQLRIGLAHRIDERGDHRCFHAIGDVTAVGNVGELAPAIFDLFVFGECIGDKRQRADIGFKGFSKRMGGLFASLAVAVRQTAQRCLQRLCLAINLEGEARERLIIKPVPCATTRHALFMQQRLKLVGQLIRLHGTQIAQPGRISRASADEVNADAMSASVRRFSSSVKNNRSVEIAVTRSCMSP